MGMDDTSNSNVRTHNTYSEHAVWGRLLVLMPCPFLALSATLANAEQLCRWLNSVQCDAPVVVSENKEDLREEKKVEVRQRGRLRQ